MYRKGVQGWLKHLDFIILDMVCLQISFVLAYMVRMGPSNPYAGEAYRSIGLVILLADAVACFLFNSFKNVLKRGYYREFAATIKHVCLVVGIVIVYLFTIQKSISYSRIVIYLMAVLYVCLGYFPRIFWKKHLQKVLAAEKSKSSLLIVTTKSMAESVIQNAEKGSYERFYIAGVAVLDCDMKGQEISGIPVVGDEGNVADAACHVWVDEVLIALPHSQVYPEEMVNQFLEMGIVVHWGLFLRSSEDDTGSGGGQPFIENLGNYRVMTTTINSATPLQQALKRLLDIAGGIVGTLITGVLFVFLAPAIYIVSPGPIFFRQERVGKNGKRFQIYKFRSMYLDAEARKRELMEKNRFTDGMMFKLDGDPRIIGSKVLPDGTVKKGLGNFMRDYSLDEFPQFVNVLKGEMSLVGTRPPTVDEWEKYQRHHRARMAVKPGITGLWQISGRSAITDFEEVVKLDTKYITDWSIGLDFRILLKTVKVVLGRKGAM
ncbi:MAG: exopolysaccharide biosynthesis polyprenyl glycosylphosphotransferase [Lachnoclostridium sp.]|nr:exopolysaccharide biosynthesis polyprenyl glycosylphosphotransferase [Lachnospira sp.]MCM1249108.1 exopolysaccharide biosynthesis polyprenyl glycosylphosphotransferase [Lachnoclostridium sp.]